jgi:membrane protease YdiL (CAAX protease family)
MYDHNSKGISYTAGFFMLIAFTIGAIFIANTIGIQVWTMMTGKNYQQYLSGMTDPANAGAYKVLQAINELTGYFLPAVVVAHLLHKQPMKLLGFSPVITAKQIGLVFFITVAAVFIGGALSYVNHEIPIPADWRIKFDELEESYKKQSEAILALKNSGDYILALIVMAFIPALCEETLFRGGLQNFLTRSTRSPLLSIIIVSIIFSAAHFSFYGFLFRFSLGAVLGLIYNYSGKLWLSILAHFLNNAFVVTLFYIYTRQGKPLDQAMEESASSYWGFLLLPVLIGLFMVFKRISFGSEILTKQSNN